MNLSLRGPLQSRGTALALFAVLTFSGVTIWAEPAILVSPQRDRSDRLDYAEEQEGICGSYQRGLDASDDLFSLCGRRNS